MHVFFFYSIKLKIGFFPALFLKQYWTRNIISYTIYFSQILLLWYKDGSIIFLIEVLFKMIQIQFKIQISIGTSYFLILSNE